MTGRMGQSGMTLAELLVVIGLAGVLSSFVGTSAYQSMKVTERGIDELSAIHDIRNAGQWILLDGQRAQTIDLVDGGDPVNAMTLGWSESGVSHTSSYSVSGTELQRDYDGTVIVVARHISGVEFSISQRLLQARVISSPSSTTSKQLTYEVLLRPQQ